MQLHLKCISSSLLLENTLIPEDFLIDSQKGTLHPVWQSAIEEGEILDGDISKFYIDHVIFGHDQSLVQTELARKIYEAWKKLRPWELRNEFYSYNYFEGFKFSKTESTLGPDN